MVPEWGKSCQKPAYDNAQRHLWAAAAAAASAKMQTTTLACAHKVQINSKLVDKGVKGHNCGESCGHFWQGGTRGGSSADSVWHIKLEWIFIESVNMASNQSHQNYRQSKRKKREREAEVELPLLGDIFGRDLCAYL